MTPTARDFLRRLPIVTPLYSGADRAAFAECTQKGWCQLVKEDNEHGFRPSYFVDRTDAGTAALEKENA